MRTILIPIFQAVEAKNILRTEVIKALLADPDVRVVCLSRFPERAAYYQKEIAHERIIYDSFAGVISGPVEKIFSFLKFHLIRTRTTKLRKELRRRDSANHLLYFATLFFDYLIARRSVRQFLRFFDQRFVGDCGFGAVLEKHNPDVVFLANLFDDGEIALLREAKRKNIPTVGFINSWDKLTARCSIRLLPDRMAVFNDIVKNEAGRYADMPGERIAVCGIPQYDQYVFYRPSGRDAFFKKAGLDPAKRLILYAPMGAAFSRSDWDMIDFLHLLFSQNEIGEKAQLLVRFQPNDYADEREIKKRPWLLYDLPGIRYGAERGGDWDLDFKDLKHLADTLAYLSVLVGYASSMSIDAAVFGKPIININFELGRGPMAKSPTQFYKTEHYQKAMQSGGIRLVHTKGELLRWLNAYLADPVLDKEGRERLVREQCFWLDGKAGERIAKVILRAARGNSQGNGRVL